MRIPATSTLSTVSRRRKIGLPFSGGRRLHMQKRSGGRTELPTPPMVFGGNVFGWTADAKTSFDILDRFAAAGLDAIDTADVYSAWAPGNSGGESETIIGEWMKARGNRNRVIIITKVGSPMGKGKEGLNPHYIAEAVEASLKRL